MKAVICLLVLILTVNAAKVHKSGYVSSQHIGELKQGNTWASLLINLAEMHMLAKGPFDDLVAAIQSVIEDLNVKTENANAQFDQRTQQHESDVRRFNELITEAQKNIADTQALLANVLFPQREQLYAQIADLERRIQETKVYIETQTENRKIANQEFTVRIQEHSEAISILNEALGVLAQLEDGTTSLVQIKKAHKQMEKATQVLQKHKYSVESTMIRSLLQLSTSEFVNQDAVQKVKELMLTVQGNLEQSIVDETNAEEKAQEAFLADVIRANNDIATFTANLEETQRQVSITEEQIVSAQQLIEERQRDLEEYQADLEAENADYEEATRVYEDLIATLEAESTACQEALEVVQGATIEDYIGGRITQTSEHVIGTNHGSGVEVAGGRFQFN